MIIVGFSLLCKVKMSFLLKGGNVFVKVKFEDVILKFEGGWND